jgi:hypothetical protein
MGLENLLKYIEAITLLLPLIEKIVTMIEGLFGKLGVGQGAAKKEAATDLAGLVDSVVKIKNQTGVFTHGLSRAPPDPTESPFFKKT